MDKTTRLALPLLISGQADKESFHNEALQQLDVLVGAAVEECGRNDPPSASAGQCYLVGNAPTGEWVQQQGAIAAMTKGGWRFIAPFEGLRIYDRQSGYFVTRRQGSWEAGVVAASELRCAGVKVVGLRQAAIPSPVGGAVADVEARAAISSILGALRAHGLIAS